MCLTEHYSELGDGVDPVVLADQFLPGSFTHSTSWRWLQEAVVLTFVHVTSDGVVLPNADVIRLTPSKIEEHSVACHAVRHLHFLFHTNQEVAALPGLQDFWAYAEEVVAQHHPAVAGLLINSDMNRAVELPHNHGWNQLASTLPTID